MPPHVKYTQLTYLFSFHMSRSVLAVEISHQCMGAFALAQKVIHLKRGLQQNRSGLGVAAGKVDKRFLQNEVHSQTKVSRFTTLVSFSWLIPLPQDEKSASGQYLLSPG